MPVEIIKNDTKGYEQFMKELEKFKSSYIKVGVLESSDPHTTTDDEGKEEVTPMVMIAAVHEFGLPEQGIPERSFIRSWATENADQVQNLIKALMSAIAKGSLSAQEALAKLGDAGEKGIKEKFRSNDWAPLKHREGTPLIDTGQLRNSIHHQVVEGGME